MKEIITRTIHRFGEPVELHYRDVSAGVLYLTGLVQRPAAESFVNDFDMTFFVVYLSAADVSVPPTKFDRVRVRGETRGVEEVQVENAEGRNLVYVLRTRG